MQYTFLEIISLHSVTVLATSLIKRILVLLNTFPFIETFTLKLVIFFTVNFAQFFIILATSIEKILKKKKKPKKRQKMPFEKVESNTNANKDDISQSVNNDGQSEASSRAVGKGNGSKRSSGSTNGRRKIVIKPILHAATRRATFEKRRIGLLKKAMELSILCSSTVSVTIYTPAGDVYIYSSEPFENVIHKFQRYNGPYRLLTNDHLPEMVPGKAKSSGVGYEILKQSPTSPHNPNNPNSNSNILKPSNALQFNQFGATTIPQSGSMVGMNMNPINPINPMSPFPHDISMQGASGFSTMTTNPIFHGMTNLPPNHPIFMQQQRQLQQLQQHQQQQQLSNQVLPILTNSSNTNTTNTRSSFTINNSSNSGTLDDKIHIKSESSNSTNPMDNNNNNNINHIHNNPIMQTDKKRTFHQFANDNSSDDNINNKQLSSLIPMPPNKRLFGQLQLRDGHGPGAGATNEFMTTTQSMEFLRNGGMLSNSELVSLEFSPRHLVGPIDDHQMDTTLHQLPPPPHINQNILSHDNNNNNDNDNDTTIKK